MDNKKISCYPKQNRPSDSSRPYAIEEREYSPSQHIVCNVWSSTFDYYAKMMKRLITETNCKWIGVSCTTGLVLQCRQWVQVHNYSWTVPERCYRNLRIAANAMDPVQIGFTLFNDDKTGKEISTFQFNLRITHNLWDNQSPKNLSQLFYDDFSLQKHKDDGVLVSDLITLFTENSISTPSMGRLITYDGGLTYVYLVKFLNNNTLPLKYDQFDKLFKLLLPQAFDLKQLCKSRKPLLAKLHSHKEGLHVNHILKLSDLANIVGCEDRNQVDLSQSGFRAILIASIFQLINFTRYEKSRWGVWNHRIYDLNVNN